MQAHAGAGREPRCALSIGPSPHPWSTRRTPRFRTLMTDCHLRIAEWLADNALRMQTARTCPLVEWVSSTREQNGCPWP
jgi:hypothetical protein